jgi:hypothetical protein
MSLKKNRLAKAQLFIIHGHSTAPTLLCIVFSPILEPASSETISLPNPQAFPKAFATVGHSQHSIFMLFQQALSFFEALPIFGSIFYSASRPSGPKPRNFSPILPPCLSALPRLTLRFSRAAIPIFQAASSHIASSPKSSARLPA